MVTRADHFPYNDWSAAARFELPGAGPLVEQSQRTYSDANFLDSPQWLKRATAVERRGRTSADIWGI